MQLVNVRISSFFLETTSLIFFPFSLLDTRPSFVEGGKVAIIAALIESLIPLVYVVLKYWTSKEISDF